MIKELVELAMRNRKYKEKNGQIVHNAIKDEEFTMVIVINNKGKFLDLIIQEEKAKTLCEALASKKGQARLLVDKKEETLSFLENSGPKSDQKKHSLYREKIEKYKKIKAMKPVLNFYSDNKQEGKQEALDILTKRVNEEIKIEYEKEVDNSKTIKQIELKKKIQNKVYKKYKGNMVFMLKSTGKLINEEPEILEALITNDEQEFKDMASKPCSVCAKSDFPILDKPYGMIKRVPDGQSSGSALISFNENVFESYNLTGNLNAQICTSCGLAHVEALNYLLQPSRRIKDEKGKEKPEYDNRYDFGSDTAVVFWTRKVSKFNPKKILDSSSSHDLRGLFDSVNKTRQTEIKTNDFYAITLSGSSARIMVRDYIQSSVATIESNLVQWFEDIDIGQKNDNGAATFAPLWRLAESTRRANDSKKNDTAPARVQILLWRAATNSTTVPLWVLYAVVHRIRMDSYQLKDSEGLSFNQVFSNTRISLVKLVLNRLKKGERIMKQLNETSDDIGYNCGRAFALLAKIQYHAAKRDLNVGIVNRSYSSASTTPASAFGRLFKNVQHHLTKVGGVNKGLAINLEKELAEIANHISDFPQVLSLEQQGRFALGFYQQRHKDFSKGEGEKS